MKLNEERINEISDAIKDFGIYSILRLEENYDPQFKSIQNVSQRIGKNYSSAYSLLVSLVSYRLAMKGEDWWDCFSKYFSEKDIPKNYDELIKNVIDFINSCRGSIIGRENKIKRIKKVSLNARDLLIKILNEPNLILNEPNKIMKEISKALNSQEWRKTISFSIKMAYYAVKDRNELKPLLIKIPLPIDLRISCITYTSNLIDAESYKKILSSPKMAIYAWDCISEKSGVPQIHLDSLLWTIGWIPRNMGIKEGRKKVVDILKNISDEEKSEKIAEQFLIKECR